MSLGLIETARAAGGHVPLWPQHLARLRSSAAALGLPIPDRLPAAEEVAAAAQTVSSPVAAVRLTLRDGAASLAARAVPRVDGWRACLAPGPRATPSRLIGHKTDQRSDCEAAARHANEHGCDEALWVDAAGCLTEGTVSNLFVRIGRDLLTPTASGGVLPGVARRQLLSAGRLDGFRVVEADIPPEDLAAADEVFVTNAVRGAVPLLTWEQRPLNRGALWRVARSAIFGLPCE